jgi:hypothetical protein
MFTSAALKSGKEISQSYVFSIFMPAMLIVLLACMTTAGMAQERSKTNVEEPVLRAEQRSEIEQALEERGQARIIVEVVLEQPRQVESKLSAPQVQAQRDHIKQELQQFSDSMEAEASRRSTPQTPIRLEVHHLFETLPYMVITVDEAGFEALLQRDDISRIQPDQLAKPQMDDTVALTGATQAWSAGYTGNGQSVVIMDTGTQQDHPNLSPNIQTEACFSSNDAGYVATSLCTDGDTERTTGTTYDCSIVDGFNPCAHGTHVAGTVAGTGTGFSGMAPDAGLIPIQVFSRFDDPGICDGNAPCVLAFFSDQLKAYEHTYTTLQHSHDIAAINVSLGGGQYPNTCDYNLLKPMIDQLRDDDIATIIASGNDGSTSFGISPGCISSAVTVGSTTKTDNVSWFSNSPLYIDILAPGSSITSTIPENSFATYQGTSMATPHVAGAWALLAEKYPDEEVGQLLNRLQRTGVPITDTRNGLNRTVARIQVDAALEAPSPPAAVAFEDNFENLDSNGIPEGWSISDSGNGQGWRFDNPGSRNVGFSSTFAIMDSDFYGDGNTQNAVLQSPPIAIDVFDAPMLSFTHHLDTRAGGFAEIEVSGDGGLSYTTAFDSDDLNIVRGGSSDNPETVLMLVNLDYYLEDEVDEVLIRWRYTGDYSYYWAIDDIRLSAGVAFSEFTDELQGTHPGWRFLTVPANTASYADLLSQVWTQGIPGAQSTGGSPSVLLYDESANAWINPDNLNYHAGLNADENTPNAGLGLVAYIFEKDNPGSEEITWPKSLQASGYPFYDEVVRELPRTDYGGGNSGGWHLIGNPYPFPISWIDIVQNDGGSALQNVHTGIFIWDANINGGAGGYRFNYGAAPDPGLGEQAHSGIIPPFQGFWVRVANGGASGSITFTPEHKATESGTLYRGISAPQPEARQRRHASWFRTGIRVAPDLAAAEKSAVVLLNFGEEDKAGFSAPLNLSEPGISLNLLGGAQHNKPQIFQYHHMQNGDERIIPLSFEAQESGSYQISMFGDGTVPPHIEVPEIYLLDELTGEEHLLYSSGNGAQESYTFEYQAEKAANDSDEAGKQEDALALDMPSPPVNQEADEASVSDTRFSLRLSTGTPLSSGEATGADLPAEISLRQNYPNPFNPATTLAFALPEATEVRLEVFNVAGQRVALLEEGRRPAGEHQLRFDASGLSSGVYLYRLRAGNETLTRRMTVVK